MRIPLLSKLAITPFEILGDHAEKVKECAWIFQQAMECHVTLKCESFDELQNEVVKLEIEADAIKHQIRKHMPSSFLLPVDKYQFYYYLKEQDLILDAVIDSGQFFNRIDDGINQQKNISGCFRINSEKWFRKSFEPFGSRNIRPTRLRKRSSSRYSV